MTCDISNGKGAKIFSLNGFLLGENLNIIDGVAHTSPTNFKGIMGLPEQVASNLFLPDGVFSLWSRDQPDPVQTGTLPSSNMYGTHPVYFAKATDKTWYGVFTNLAAAQDWFVSNDATTGDVGVKTMAAGGVGDLFFFFGSTPNEMTESYHKIIGKPVLTPQWALGWHQCRWGYTDTQMLRDVVNNYTDLNLPFNTMWSDIDYMDNYKDFTVDPVNFQDLGSFVTEIQGKNLSYVPIVDAGIAKRDYPAYNDGIAQDVFIKAPAGDPFIGRVWPNDAVYPDFFNPNTTGWWGAALKGFHDQVPFNGLWLDMNEASNFCNGYCYGN
jgi:alpha-glucosidase (family GH31 glycosyl hydrolase)